LPTWRTKWWGVQRFEVNIDARFVAKKLICRIAVAADDAEGTGDGGYEPNTLSLVN